MKMTRDAFASSGTKTPELPIYHGFGLKSETVFIHCEPAVAWEGGARLASKPFIEKQLQSKYNTNKHSLSPTCLLFSNKIE